MKIVSTKDGLLITECFSGVGFESTDGEFLGVCMRDGGYEINYGGKWHTLRSGIITTPEETKSVPTETNIPHTPTLAVAKDD